MAGKRNRDSTKTDLSSFMCIVLMLTGCLVAIMISNIMIIAANPENVVITSVIRSHSYLEGVPEVVDLSGSLFPKGNKQKEARYIDIHRDHLTLYPGEIVVPLRDLENPDNQFEAFVSQVEAKKEEDYIVLLVRPYSSMVARRLRKVIKDRGIDLGFELFEAGRPVKYEGRTRFTAAE